MKIVLVISFCLFFSLSALAQSEKTNNAAKVNIEEITMARDSGNGKAGETTDQFLTTDNPIYCIVQLDSLKSTTVKMFLVAVKADGLKPETKSVSVSYTTNGKQNRVNFNASPDGDWAAGDYRVDIFIDGEFAKSHSFEIKNSPKEAGTQKQITPKSLVSRKNIKKPRKN